MKKAEKCVKLIQEGVGKMHNIMRWLGVAEDIRQQKKIKHLLSITVVI
jgi:hypothetical protein